MDRTNVTWCEKAEIGTLTELKLFVENETGKIYAKLGDEYKVLVTDLKKNGGRPIKTKVNMEND